jgi:branched-chain amino acid transport system permease protein
MLTQILIDTAVGTAQLGLVAVGLTMTWGLTRFANVAHVQFAPVGAYLALVITSGLGLGMLLGSLVAVVVTGLLAVLLHTFFFRRLARFGSFTPLIGSLALSIVITASIQTIFGPRPDRLPMPLAPGHRIGDAVITDAQIRIIATAAVVLVGVFLFLGLTSLGRAIRATAANPELASASGIDVRRTTAAVTFGAGGLAALAGVLVAMDTSVSLGIGETMLLAMFAAVIMGGIGSAAGALLAAAILTAVEATLLRVDLGALVGGSWLMPIEYRPAIGFLAVILVMLLRPEGLFGFGGRRA